MAPIRPSAAKTPLVLVRQEAVIVLPALTQVGQELFAEERSVASPPAPEAVESWLLAAQAAIPVSIKHAPTRSAQFGAPPAHIIIDTDADEALWFSSAGNQVVRLDAPLERPVPKLQALPDWLKAADRLRAQAPG